MIIHLSRDALTQHEVTLGEVLLLIAYSNNCNLKEADTTLREKKLVSNEIPGQPNRVTYLGTELLNSVILDSEFTKDTDDRFSTLASRLKELFPKGKKDGTNYYWAEGIALIVRRLKLFFKKYGDKYTDDQIVEAAKSYVESFNGDYRYMKLLKYFILKEQIGAAGDIEGNSELLSYLENADQTDNLKNDWTSSIN